MNDTPAFIDLYGVQVSFDGAPFSFVMTRDRSVKLYPTLELAVEEREKCIDRVKGRVLRCRLLCEVVE